jgi:hypothetical protein
MSGFPSRTILRGDWQVLESSTVSNLASLPITGLEPEGARIALDEADARHLLIRTALPTRSWSEIDSPLKDAVHALTFGGVRHNYLDVRCADRRLFDVFDELILNVLEMSRGALDPGAAIDESLSQWRAMFRAMTTITFGKERRYGLFAELIVLEACVQQAGARALDMWTGPLGNPHDFELPSGCVEVKAVGATSNDVTIHGFRQLQVDRKVLQLLVYKVAESSQGRKLTEIIASIESRVGAGALTAALERTGYAASAPDERLIVADSFAVLVDERLPALTGRTVDSLSFNGISRVEYDIPLSVLAQVAEATPTSAVIGKAMQE